jgi:hypothetical protein
MSVEPPDASLALERYLAGASMIDPIVRRVSRDSLSTSLIETRAAVMSEAGAANASGCSDAMAENRKK